MTIRETEGFSGLPVLEILEITKLNTEGMLFSHRILRLGCWALCGELFLMSNFQREAALMRGSGTGSPSTVSPGSPCKPGNRLQHEFFMKHWATSRAACSL